MITLKRTHNLLVVLLCTLFTATNINANEINSDDYADDWKNK